MDAFVHVSRPARIVFGRGRIADLTQELERLGLSRALVLSSPFQKGDAQALARRLGSRAVGLFSDAAMHTPVSVTEVAVQLFRKLDADCVVSYGGGSTTGLGKAIAFRTDCPQIVIPTTYAGSEVTPILGQTEDGNKTTLVDPKVLPEVVIYDPDLTTGLPVSMSITSGLNALSHALEGLYAQDRSPISSLMAAEGIQALKTALPEIRRNPASREARTRALYGAWLCGTVLGSVGMSIHHKLCHVLGGMLDLPHAETHAVMLPHTIGFVDAVSPAALAPAREIFGSELGTALFAFCGDLGAPQSLRSLGMEEKDIKPAVTAALARPYWCPRAVEYKSLKALMTNAWAGDMPAH
jgi:maleylacetate reductase